MLHEKKEGRWPIRLFLNSKVSSVLEFYTRHFSGRELTKKVTGAELAEKIGCDEDRLKAFFKSYNDIADGKVKYRANLEHPKKYFHNAHLNINYVFHVAVMGPVLYFTVGGVKLNEKAQVLNHEMMPFDGLFV